MSSEGFLRALGNVLLDPDHDGSEPALVPLLCPSPTDSFQLSLSFVGLSSTSKVDFVHPTLCLFSALFCDFQENEIKFHNDHYFWRVFGMFGSSSQLPCCCLWLCEATALRARQEQLQQQSSLFSGAVVGRTLGG